MAISIIIRYEITLQYKFQICYFFLPPSNNITIIYQIRSQYSQYIYIYKYLKRHNLIQQIPIELCTLPVQYHKITI